MQILKTYLKFLLATFGALIVGFLAFAIFKGVIQPRLNTVGACTGEDSCLYTMLNGRDSVRVLGFLDGDKQFITEGGSGTLIHDASSGKQVGEVDPSFRKFFTRIAPDIAPDGTQIAAINREFAEVALFDAQGEEQFTMMVNPEFKIRDFAFLPLVKGFAYSRTEHPITAMHFPTLDSPDAERITEIPQSEGAGSLASSGDGEYLAATKFAESAIYIWPIQDIDNPQIIEVPQLSPISKVQLSHDGSRVAATARGGVFVWNRADGAQIDFIRRDGPESWSFSLTPDGKQIAVAFDDGWVELWSLDDGALLQAVEHSQKPGTVALSNDGALLAVGLNDDATVTRYTEAELRALAQRGSNGQNNAAKFLSANTTYIETVPGYGVVWEVASR